MLTTKDFISIPFSCLIADNYLAFDVYILNNNKLFTLFASINSKLSSHAVLKLQLSGHIQIFILKTQSANFDLYLQQNLKYLVNSNSISSHDKAKIIYFSANETMQRLFNNPESTEAFNDSMNLVAIIMDKVLKEPKSFVSLMQISSHDYYTYTHSINVAIYAIGIAKYLRLDENIIEKIAKASMLHDIGKSKIDTNIINKPSKLTDRELNIIKMHPVYGFDILRSHNETSEDILLGVRNHHEKQDRTGYPDKIGSGQIGMIAEIITVADIFDALTSKRSYKNAISTFSALTLMRDKMRIHLNENIFNALVNCMRGD